jgi:glycine cleavage system protein P-like pyridoxal-binding family
MIEPTESEDVAELIVFVMRWFIRKEIEESSVDEPNNVLKIPTHFSNANCWHLTLPYSRETAYPLAYVAE